MDRRHVLGTVDATVLNAADWVESPMTTSRAAIPIDVTDETGYDGRPSTYRVSADRGAAAEDNSPVALLGQSTPVVRELSTALVGPSYATLDSPALLAEDLTGGPVRSRASSSDRQ